MNTSYGPRIDGDRWDFHDGIDLPARVGTQVFAMADGRVHRVGPADKNDDDQGFGSTHVLIRVVDPKDGKNDLFLVYLHLDSIAEEIIPGAQVSRGQLIGTVGQEDATYPHLHFEFRKGGAQERRSVHPLNYLPFSNTFNFGLLSQDRVNFYDGGNKRAIRLRFAVAKRQEGDLRGVEVELSNTTGTTTLTRSVDFDDRETINSSKGDEAAFKKGIAVEGYQKSNLQGDRLPDLHYGVIVKDIAALFEKVELRILDVKKEKIQSAQFILPKLLPGESPVNIREGFEGQTFPPPGSQVIVRPGNTCRLNLISGAQSLLCQDVESSPGELIRAALRFALPANRMSWRLGAVINPTELKMRRGEAVYPLAFFVGDTLLAAACFRKITTANKFFTGVLIRSVDGLYREKIDVVEGEIYPGTPVPWELELLRLHTRQTTAVLRLRDKVIARINGDTTNIEPTNACVGILHRHSRIKATLHVDELFLTEEPRF